MAILKALLICVALTIDSVVGQGFGFGQRFSPFGITQQAFGGNVFVPQNFPRPIEQTIDIERQGSFSIVPPDGAQGVQLLETTISDGNRVVFQDRPRQAGDQNGGQFNDFSGQNFGTEIITPNVQGGQRFVTRPGMTGFQNANPQVRILQNAENGGNPFPGVTRPVATFLPQGLQNMNPFLGPPATPTGELVNTIIGGFPTGFQGALPTAIPNTQINNGLQHFQGNQFQGIAGEPQFQGMPGSEQFSGMQGNQQFPGIQGNQPFPGMQGNQQFQGSQMQQGVLPTGIPIGQNGMANAVNSISGSDTFDQRFNLIDPTTNTAVQDVGNSGSQGQQSFQPNQNFLPHQNNIFDQPQNVPNQFQNQGQFSRTIQQPLQPTNQFPGSFSNQNFPNSVQTTQFNGPFAPPQFIGNRGFNPLTRSEFSSGRDVQTSTNPGFQQGNMNATIPHPSDPSIGIFLPDVVLNLAGPQGSTRFTQFGTRGFVDIFPNQPLPLPTVYTLTPGFTTISPPPSTTEGYSCQHKKCPSGQACVYDGMYRCPSWIPIIDCKCLTGCMYNDWFIPKKSAIPIDHCGNHCACQRDDGVATCSQAKCPTA